MLLLAKANGSLLKDHEIFSKVIEMTYFGSVLHSNLRQKQDKTEGKIFCDLGKLLGGNFMMLNASIMLCELNNIRLVQLQNQIILNFSSGHYSDILENGQQSTFLRKAYLRDVSTLAMGCQGIALISNSNEDNAFDYGAHLALAHKLVKDVKESKAKCCQSPLSFPSFFSDEFPENSLSKTVDLAKAHIDAALKLSSKFKNSSDLELWASSLLAKLDD
jgi:geranylgeranyl pyrophosphate synthase